MAFAARVFVIMPFGRKKGPDGVEIDFDAVYRELLEPAIREAGMQPHRADADRYAGSIHADMFQDLLLADFVIADLTLDNPNVWYELGIRHSLRAGGTLLTYALRDRLPFDIAGQRMYRYTLQDGRLDPAALPAEREMIAEAISATANIPSTRRVSPVYDQLPSLTEPRWKDLRVGRMNELWGALEAWEGRLQAARNKQRPGDILVLADEPPNRALQLEALREAAEGLVTLNQPRYALSILERALQIDPQDLRCRHLQGVALGRDLRFEEARVALRRLVDEGHRDGETLGYLAGTVKDEWKRLWAYRRQSGLDPLAAAKDTSPALGRAAEAYAEAFRVAPAHDYLGINALILGLLFRHVTGTEPGVKLALLADGIRWAVDCALQKGHGFWSLLSRAGLALVEGRAAEAVRDFADAAALAVDGRNCFGLDSAVQHLRAIRELGYQPGIVGDALGVLERAQAQMNALAGTPAASPPQPGRVILFTGHMVDDPRVRGPGREKPPRFPTARVGAADARIRAALDAVGAGAGDLGVCGGACGGDLLFASACLERGMRLEVRLAKREAAYLRESVTFADPECAWQRRFTEVTQHRSTQVLVMPDELGPVPEGMGVHDRNARWKLYSALSHGLPRVSFIALWDGSPGNGPGGTESMVKLVHQLTGHRPTIIDPATLG
ncbi:MAG TPA: tetratricopeptide repeat-containing protein [Myxococcaceae bacterium]|jgi:hypothetical protein